MLHLLQSAHVKNQRNFLAGERESRGRSGGYNVAHTHTYIYVAHGNSKTGCHSHYDVMLAHGATLFIETSSNIALSLFGRNFSLVIPTLNLACLKATVAVPEVVVAVTRKHTCHCQYPNQFSNKHFSSGYLVYHLFTRDCFARRTACSCIHPIDKKPECYNTVHVYKAAITLAFSGQRVAVLFRSLRKEPAITTTPSFAPLARPGHTESQQCQHARTSLTLESFYCVS